MRNCWRNNTRHDSVDDAGDKAHQRGRHAASGREQIQYMQGNGWHRHRAANCVKKDRHDCPWQLRWQQQVVDKIHCRCGAHEGVGAGYGLIGLQFARRTTGKIGTRHDAGNSWQKQPGVLLRAKLQMLRQINRRGKNVEKKPVEVKPHRKRQQQKLRRRANLAIAKQQWARPECMPTFFGQRFMKTEMAHDHQDQRDRRHEPENRLPAKPGVQMSAQNRRDGGCQAEP